jgi:CelD/BcsL family acetyltransferase involved in cellulose biosynthesis
LLQDDEAMARLDDAGFCRAWRELYLQCPWASAYQDPAYVGNWYRQYRGAWRPLLAAGFDAEGALAGLMALARSPARDRDRLVGAGAAQAAYQVWLARSDAAADDYILEALDSLRRALPRACLHLKHLPAGTPVAALRAAAARYGCVFSAPEPRCWIRTDSERVLESLNGKTKRNLANRLKRIGAIRLEVASDAARMEALLDEHIRQCDLRQAALYDCAPFRSDPAKRGFYLRLLRAGRLHVSALHAGQALVSTNVGIVGKRSVQIGIAHAPQYAECSPGRLHLYLLCVELARCGIPVFDLTPGAGYKSAMATDADEALELTALDARRGRRLQRRAQLMKAAVAWLAQRGISSTDVRLFAGRASKLARLAVGGAQPWRRDCVYAAPDAAPHPAMPALAVGVDSLDDLLQYDAARGVKTYQQFQFDAMKRLERGQHAYTVSGGGRLLCCAWLRQMPDAIELYDLYRHPALGSGMLPGFLAQLLADLGKRADIGRLRLLVHAGDRRLRGEVEEAGFGTGPWAHGSMDP